KIYTKQLFVHVTICLSLKCPPGSHYTPCGPACEQPSCQDPAGPGGSCNHPCVEGCICDPGLVLSGDKCVSINDCCNCQQCTVWRC
uniref:TIL domain-containing protein n=1 Tax=Acanthochromis polyacanthus TaxID=80966 RepID=A0A3Q1H733_9TELE